MSLVGRKIGTRDSDTEGRLRLYGRPTGLVPEPLKERTDAVRNRRAGGRRFCLSRRGLSRFWGRHERLRRMIFRNERVAFYAALKDQRRPHTYTTHQNDQARIGRLLHF